ncbi:hypothetical protein BD324DRAFT_602175 [Kockovaella imperatae]|uniref:Right handed beta helix domain-containing protein n=1 Tax=Kockovaella imperatae TaxID=4999 RepID=A0A1Y1UFW6_9TREE|nr:hypothetical protein BD324DRAFT_602175 [Kockovaella imperatae]ORX36427.1 hypothetical protein BD324DRAFT_602175 [Kockovaella imperatae]
MRIRTLVWALALVLPTAVVADCLRFADANTINQAFIDGGAGKQVFLCPSRIYRLREPIIFTAADQELATQGYPTGSERAILEVADDFATAIQGDCRRCARTKIKSVIVDGGRKALGRIPPHRESTGLVVIGGNEGQAIQHCSLRDPRGYTAIHVREGDNVDCKNALIENNEIGPVGEEYRPDIDGPDPEIAPLGRPLADGLCIACKNSIVRDNTFIDNTDAAIVVYCSPGSLIHANMIIARSMSAMAGILMVDATPFDGNYKLTTVKGNIIDAQGKIIRVGIGAGPPVLSDDTETYLTGGRVLANGFRGPYMGFGIAAAGLDDWMIKDNWDEATHIGNRSARCFDDPVNPDPIAFVRHPNVKNSELQREFVEEAFEYVVCIEAEHEASSSPIPVFEENPVEETPTTYSTGSEPMDEILEHSQQRMLDAIDALGRRVDILAEAHHPIEDDSPVVVAPLVTETLGDFQNRIDQLENRQHAMLDSATEMRKAIRAWNQQLSNMNEWEYEVLLDVSHKLGIFLRESEKTETDAQVNHAILSRATPGALSAHWNWSWTLVLTAAAVTTLLGYWRLSRRRHRTKMQ